MPALRETSSVVHCKECEVLLPQSETTAPANTRGRNGISEANVKLRRLISALLLFSVFSLSLSASTCELECCGESAARNTDASPQSVAPDHHTHGMSPHEMTGAARPACHLQSAEECHACVQDELARNVAPSQDVVSSASVSTVHPGSDATPALDCPATTATTSHPSPPQGLALRI